MVAETIRTDTIANNLANVNTTGYKKDTAVNKSFGDMLIHRINDGESAPYIGSLGLGTAIDEIGRSPDQGSFIQTENPLNLAIEGSGYFAVDTPSGTRYTRDGTFSINAQGQLVTMDGNPVLGENGPIQIDFENSTLANLNIDSTGRITATAVDGLGIAELGNLQLASFTDERQLLKQGNNLYNADNAVGGPLPFTGTVIQGYLEQSNTNAISEMVNLIATYRAYEINSKAVRTQDEMLGKAVTEVGKV
jgi:flagellar basal-body rod protein FlgG